MRPFKPQFDTLTIDRNELEKHQTQYGYVAERFKTASEQVASLNEELIRST